MVTKPEAYEIRHASGNDCGTAEAVNSVWVFSYRTSLALDDCNFGFAVIAKSFATRPECFPLWIVDFTTKAGCFTVLIEREPLDSVHVFV